LAGGALLLAGLAIAGAPPFVVFLSEFSIFRAGLDQGQYFVTGLLAVFVTIAFFGILLHINRMVFGTPDDNFTKLSGLPVSCVLVLVSSAALIVFLGFDLPEPVHALLRLAASGS